MPTKGLAGWRKIVKEHRTDLVPLKLTKKDF